jgi:Zn-dependent peptidase ImmA (M78 family)
LNKEEIEQRVRETLARHGIADTAIPIDPVRIANGEGIKVFNVIFDNQDTEGMIAHRNHSTKIYVNSQRHPVRKRFTIAHELGHFHLHMLGTDGEYVDTSDNFRTTFDPTEPWSESRRKEWEANQFASILLLPEAPLRMYWQKSPDIETICGIFQVSRQALLLRLDALGLLL